MSFNLRQVCIFYPLRFGRHDLSWLGGKIHFPPQGDSQGMTRRRQKYSTQNGRTPEYSTSDRGLLSTGLASILFEGQLASYRLERKMRDQDADENFSEATSHKPSVMGRWIRRTFWYAVDVTKAAFMVFVWQLLLNIVRVVVYIASTIVIFCVAGVIIYLMLTTWPDW